MLIDHSAVLFCDPDSPYYIFLRGFGRLSFPIFAYLVADSCRKTHDLPGYLKRIFLFALVAQIPFTLVTQSFSGSVLLTFFLAGAAISLYASAREHVPAPVAVLPALLMALMAYWLDADYGALGVLVIFALYLCGENRPAKYVCLVMGLYLFYHNIFFIFACIPVLLLSFYNDTRGRDQRWFFYVFYPGHLLMLYLLWRCIA